MIELRYKDDKIAAVITSENFAQNRRKFTRSKSSIRASPSDDFWALGNRPQRSLASPDSFIAFFTTVKSRRGSSRYLLFVIKALLLPYQSWESREVCPPNQTKWERKKSWDRFVFLKIWSADGHITWRVSARRWKKNINECVFLVKVSQVSNVLCTSFGGDISFKVIDYIAANRATNALQKFRKMYNWSLTPRGFGASENHEWYQMKLLQLIHR